MLQTIRNDDQKKAKGRPAMDGLVVPRLTCRNLAEICRTPKLEKSKGKPYENWDTSIVDAIFCARICKYN